MAEKEVYIGSVGPYLYDDTEFPEGIYTTGVIKCAPGSDASHVATLGDLAGYVLEPIITGEDIEITDFTCGLILRSPDDSRWRITVDNAGVLHVAAA